MSTAPAPLKSQTNMVPTLAPCVVIHTMGRKTALETDLMWVLYICTSPYNPEAWQHILETTNLSLSFPNLVHDITYGSPIGNPPPLSMSFLPSNLPSANIPPELIDQELAVEVAAR